MRRLNRGLQVIVSLMLVAWWGGDAHGVQEELPNILWLTSEDNGPQLGCYGDPHADTPNIDALAARGMMYLNVWSNAPVCAPARTAIITGMYPPSLGAQHMRSMVPLPPQVLMYPQYLRQRGYYCTNNSKTDYNVASAGKVWDASSNSAHWKNRAAGQPFFAVFNFTTSHESRIRARPHQQVHDPAQARVPAYHPDTPEVRRDWAQYYDVVSVMDRQVGAALKELEDAGLAEDTIVFYYGDHGSGMPRSKRWPYNSGLHVPLLVRVPEKWKQLAPAGYQAGGRSSELVGFVDLAPTVLSLAGIEPPAHMHGRALMGPRAKSAPQYMFGFRGRMDERYDMVRSVRDERFVYVRNYMPHRIYGQHVSYMFQTPTTVVWKRLFDEGKLNPQQSAFWKPKPAEELYDLQQDPDEVTNLATSTERQKTLQRLRQAHRQHAAAICDLGFLPESEILARAADRSPWEMGREMPEDLLQQIIAAADRATNGRREELPQLLLDIKHSDSAVRYWATTGLLIRGSAAADAGREGLLVALRDPSPPVRIVAAEALAQLGQPADRTAALDVLLELSDPTRNPVTVAIQALNSIDQLDDKASPILDSIRQLPTEARQGTPQRYLSYVPRLLEKITADFEGS